MKPTASDFFQRLADAFIAGDHTWLSGIYIHPLVVYVGGEITLERTREETLASLFQRREKALLAGTERIESTVVEIGADDSGRFPVRVRWEFLSAAGRLIATNDLRYFCRYVSNGDLKIEILEFISRGFDKDTPPGDSSVH